MDNATKVGIKALHYRVAINEFMGITIAVSITAITAIVLFIIKLHHEIIIDITTFIVIFVVLFIALYFISLLQYKNLKYIIEQNAISFQRGSFGVERETIPFEKIKNSTYDQTIIQRLFSVGDITIDQDDEKYVWENIDSATASLISNTVSAKGDVQPITVATLNTLANATLQQNENK